MMNDSIQERKTRESKIKRGGKGRLQIVENEDQDELETFNFDYRNMLAIFMK